MQSILRTLRPFNRLILRTMNLKRHHVLYILLALTLIIALIVLLTPGVPSVSYTAPRTASTTASMIVSTSTPPGQAMKFEIVTTTAAQERGLGGRTDIAENYAMLFVFPSDQRIGFWMKDMLTSIDMIWLSDNGTVLGIEDNVAANSYPKIFYPPQPVKYVLETRAGEAHRQGWSIGTKIQLPLPYGS